MVFENKVLYAMKGEVPEGDEGIPLGKADIKREGSDVTIVAISRMVHQSLAAAETLADEGIEVEVVDPRTLSPLDEDTILSSVEKTHRLVVVDEDNPRCSVATDIAAMVADKGFDLLDAPIKIVTAPHTPVPFSPPLEQFYIPSPERIAETVRSICSGSSDESRRESRLDSLALRSAPRPEGALMATVVKMPKWGLTMTAGTVTDWLARAKAAEICRGRPAPDGRDREGGQRRRGAGRRRPAQDRRRRRAPRCRSAARSRSSPRRTNRSPTTRSPP